MKIARTIFHSCSQARSASEEKPLQGLPSLARLARGTAAGVAAKPKAAKHSVIRHPSFVIPRRAARQGMALLVVLVVVALLALGGYAFTASMLNERRAAQAYGRRLQSLAAAESGVALVMQFLAQDAATRAAAGGVYNNPLLFQGAPLLQGASASDRVRFAVLASDVTETGVVQFRFGLEDESARLNLNALVADNSAYKPQGQTSGPTGGANSVAAGGNTASGGRQSPGGGNNSSGGSGNSGNGGGNNSSGGNNNGNGGASNASSSGGGFTIGAAGDDSADAAPADPATNALMALPGMTEDTADAILDWIDADDQPRPLGAEYDYYAGLSPPYAPKNGPLDTLEELLMVRGVTPVLLFGLDQDRNGVITPRERAVGAALGVPNDGTMDFGWAAHLTLHSAEPTATGAGETRVDLNGSDLAQLYDGLQAAFDPEWADFIVAYRQFGPVSGGAQALGGAAPNITIDTSQPAQFQLQSVLDLIGVSVQVSSQGGAVLPSPFSSDPAEMASYLPELLDAAMVGGKGTVGRININQASPVVLATIPGITDETIEAILTNRLPEPTPDAPSQQHPTWLLTEGLIGLDQMKQLMPYVTGGGAVYRATVIGYTDAPGPAARVEVVIDASQSPPRLLSWKDRSHLGIGYSKALLGGGM
jgi:type II secretory pathway component PulK